MDRMLRGARLFAGVTLLLSMVVPLAAAVAQDASPPAELAWDQAKVSALAQQLAESVGKVQSSVSKLKTGSTVGSGQANAYLRLKDDLRVTRNMSRSLAKQLADGDGRDATASTYRRLMTLVRDVRENGRKMFLAKPTLDEAAHAGEILDQLAPYYAGAPADEKAGTGSGD